MTPVRFPLTRLADRELFAVDSSTAQLSIRGPGPVAVRIDDRLAEATGRDSALVAFEDLRPDTDYEAHVSSAAGTTATDERPLRFRTRSDIGPVRARIATISDVHLGLEGFGLVRKLRSDSDEPFPLVCARAAIREAEAWGAELLLVKGDLCESGTVAEWELAAELIAGTTIPVMAVAGNHEVSRKREVSSREGFALAGLDSAPVQIRDLAGARVILADTSIERRGSGRLRPVGDALIDAVRASTTPILMALHHNIERLPVPWFWPPGIRRHEARPLVDELARSGTPLFMTCGHTHRHRRHRLGSDRSVLFTEVGSTSDYPGVWAGYEVGSSAIRQTVRRIADPAARAWTDRTVRAVGGIWPRWSQGRLDDRCVDLPLP